MPTSPSPNPASSVPPESSRRRPMPSRRRPKPPASATSTSGGLPRRGTRSAGMRWASAANTCTCSPTRRPSGRRATPSTPPCWPSRACSRLTASSSASSNPPAPTCAARWPGSRLPGLASQHHVDLTGDLGRGRADLARPGAGELALLVDQVFVEVPFGQRALARLAADPLVEAVRVHADDLLLGRHGEGDAVVGLAELGDLGLGLGLLRAEVVRR